MTVPVTIRYRPAGPLAGDDLRLAFEVEAARWGSFGEFVDQHTDAGDLITVVQPRTAGGATALTAAVDDAHRRGGRHSRVVSATSRSTDGT